MTDDLYLKNYKAPVKETGNSMLGKDAFLKLLITQLQNQDPTNPMDDREFIAQMAQFSSLEQMQNMTKAMESLLLSQQQSQLMEYTNFIGKDVKWHELSEEKDKEGNFIVKEGNGIIQSVQFKDGEAIFTLADGKTIGSGNISGVLGNGAVSNNESPLVQASALIGKKVTYKEDETEVEARVISVSNKDGKMTYVLDNDKKVTADQFTVISE
ncbi:flagellar basal body rod modification protein FlgD [Lysinibacillus sp. BF-4]|nr:flagellar basal body rod modification protein FlgD [Lysinibacillus sp. BF-4]